VGVVPAITQVQKRSRRGARRALLLGLLALTVSLPHAGSAAAPPRTLVLAHEFLGDDGSALYLRQSGTLIVGFGEHANGSYAYVLRGTLAGDVVTAQFWDVPKGTRMTNGNLTLKVTLAGKALTRTSTTKVGASVWLAHATTWGGPRAAGFQATTQSNLNGVFAGDDASRHYVREQGSDIVWVGEAGTQPDVRPAWVTVFLGKRTASGGVNGTFADVAKGLASAKGSFGAAFPSAARRLLLSQTGVSRTKSLQPEYALDYDKFAQKIQDALDDSGKKVAGFAYAIANRGALLRSNAWGDRIKKVDGGPKPYTTSTMGQAGSTSKTLTAVALIKALHTHGISLDTPIRQYLPSCWKRGPSVEGYTFRMLLNHTTALPKNPPCKTDSTGRADPYDCLLKAVEIGQDGIVLPTSDYWSRYNNTAYGLMRILVPAVLDLKNTQAEFERWKCKNTSGILNAKISERFVHYLFAEVLGPADAKASFYPSSSVVAYNYDKNDLTKKGGQPDVSFSRRAGAGWLAISALDMVRFLGALDRGELIPASLVSEMERDNLGFDPPAAGAAGSYFTKNGTCPKRNGRSCAAQLMLYPGGIEAFVIVNSDTGLSPAALLQQAFDGALR
jgi:CubicO group peptidase (beta-lactamase class C family)